MSKSFDRVVDGIFWLTDFALNVITILAASYGTLLAATYFLQESMFNMEPAIQIKAAGFCLSITFTMMIAEIKTINTRLRKIERWVDRS